MTFQNIINRLIGLTAATTPVLIGLAVIVFLYGLLNYIYSGGDEKKRSESVKYIFYGIIGLFIMVSFWSLAFIFSEFFGLQTIIPQIR
jgi:heme/copper-type cytochrome/quinol oxidase subunit 4